MEAMSPGSDDENNSPERHHRDDAETIDKLTKERFRLQLRIYHMEEQMKETHGADWKSSLNQKIEVIRQLIRAVKFHTHRYAQLLHKPLVKYTHGLTPLTSFYRRKLSQEVQYVKLYPIPENWIRIA